MSGIDQFMANDITTPEPGTAHPSAPSGADAGHGDGSARLNAAESRLAAAIGRLETALENRPAVDGQVDDALAQELDGLKNENAELRELAGEAAQRLDDAIDRLKAKAGDQGAGDQGTSERANSGAKGD